MKRRGCSFFFDQSGSVAVITTVVIAACLGLAALALDIGHMLSMKNELQRAADAGALAGARALWPTNLPSTTAPPDPDCAVAIAIARSVSTSSNNKVDHVTLTNEQVTVQPGSWDKTTQTFTPGAGTNANAVRVTTQATANMFFAQVFGFGARNISATATALMGPISQVAGGTLPIAISRYFIMAGQELFVNFSPDTVDNGAWFTDPPDAASARNFRDYIDNASCPPLEVGDIINLQNGNDTSVLMDLNTALALHSGSWDVVLPVVDTTKFVGSEPITGFVPFRITNVEQSGTNKGVTGTILGALMSSTSTPGANNSGGVPTVFSSPKLL